MRQSEKDLINQYLYNNYIRLENNIKQLQSNIRFRNIDYVDNFELILALKEFETFKEISKHIRILLKLNERTD